MTIKRRGTRLTGYLVAGVFCFFFPLQTLGTESLTASVEISQSEGLSPHAVTNSGRSMTIRQAVDLAFANSPDKKISIARIKQAEAALSLADATFQPYLGFYSSYSRSNAPSTYLFKSIDQRQFKTGTDFNRPGVIGDFETGVQTRINLYNGGRDLLNKEIQQAGLEINTIDNSVIENNLTASVVKMYFNCLAAQDFITISKESKTIVQEQLRVMKVRFDKGGALKSDILSLKVRLAQADENLVQARSQYAMAMAAFAAVIGLDPNRSLDILVDERLFFHPPESYQAAAALAITNRPELIKLKKQINQAGAAFDITDGEYRPTIGAGGKLYYNDPALDYDLNRNNWTISLILNWEIFTGHSTRSKKNKAAAVIAELLAASKKTILGIKLEVKNALLKLKESEARLATAENRVAMSEESLALVKMQYEGGSATITRYLETEQDLNNSKISRTAASYDRQKALAEIARAVGRIQETVNGMDEKNYETK